MTFLYPQILWALTALSIPVIIHFFSFRKVKVIRFSAVQFLRQVDETTKNKRRIKHWLILLCRLLFLTFLILAFAQPGMKNETSGAARSIIYIDNSLSMSNEVANGQSALDEAVEYALGIVNSSPFETQYQLVTNNDYNIRDSWISAKGLKEKLTELTYSSEVFPPDKLIRQFKEYKNSSELFIISDFQLTQFSPLDELMNETDRLRLIPVRFNSTSNAFVDSVYLSSPFVFQDQQNTLIVSLRNTGDRELSDIQVKLINNDQLLGTSTVSITPNSTETVEFDIAISSLTNPKLEIQLVDFPVVFDNDFFVVLSDYKKPVISYLFTSEVRDRYIERVYANDELFDFQKMGIENPDYTRIESSDLVILEGIDELPNWATEMNTTYDLVIIPALDFRSRFLKTLPYDSEIQKLRINDINSPYFKNIFENTSQERLDLPGASIVHNLENPGIALLSNAFGVPYLSLLREEKSLYFFGSPLNQDYTNFPTHSLFVPVLYKIAQLSNQVESPLYFSLDDASISVKLKGFSPQENVVLAGESQEYIPNYLVRQDKLTLEVPPENMNGGFYYIKQDKDTLQSIALNVEKEESDLRQYDVDDLQGMVLSGKDIKVLDVTSPIILESSIKEGYQGTRLWKYALAIALFFILLEVLFIRLLK